MDRNKYEIIRLKMERTAQQIRNNNMYCECVENCEEALEVISTLLNEGDVVSCGGSVTLSQVGVIDYLKKGYFEFLDRTVPGLTKEDIEDIYIKSFSSDVYFSSANAITENGEIYNVDGNGNRVAALIYGPKSVIIVAGFNKIVKDLDEAKERICNIAAPANAVRLNRQTPCTQIGKCVDCSAEGRICSTTVILGKQGVRYKDRIKVILVGEELGY